jgi:hypothetical protein
MAHKKSKEKAAEIELRRKKVATNLLAGLSYRAMAEALGVSLGTVAADVKFGVGRWQREQVSQGAEVIGLETTRLDRALNAIWDQVLAGDKGAINTMLKIMERRAKLLRLEVVQIESKVNFETVEMTELSDAQLERIIRGEDPAVVLATG